MNWKPEPGFWSRAGREARLLATILLLIIGGVSLIAGVILLLHALGLPMWAVGILFCMLWLTGQIVCCAWRRKP